MFGRKSYYNNMVSFMIRRSFVAMLLMYCCVITTLPLSNIYIERMPNGNGYFCGQDNHEGNIHIRLHELFFSHFGNKSDHIRNISSIQPIKHKTAGNKDHLQHAIATYHSDLTMCFANHRLTPYIDGHNVEYCQYLSVSSLSPPSA